MIWSENPPVVVLLARQFNPSILTQMWLSRFGVLDSEGTFRSDSFFTENLVQVITNEFVLSVAPDQLQFVPNIEPPRQQELIGQKVGAIVENLPHVPYHGVDLNFNWHLKPEDDFAIATRRLFANRPDGVYSRFAEPNARFGTYMSKDFGPFRMKLDIKPIAFKSAEGTTEDRIQFWLNFHSDIPPGENAAKIVRERLGNWNTVRDEVIQTIRAAG